MSLKMFDTHCYDLACLFLDECEMVKESEREELASIIQRSIEDYLEELDQNREDARQAAYDAHIDAQIDERRMGERA